MHHVRSIAIVLLVAALALAGPGCPRNLGGGGDNKGTVTVLFSGMGNTFASALMDAVSPKAVVAADEIYSLTVTVTEVSLHRDDDDEDDEGEDDNGGEEGEDEGEDEGDDDKSHDDHGDDSVVIFEGAQDIDLMTLSNLSAVFSTAEIPAGTYHQIRLSIENPRLRLVDDPETEITDIHLTANGRVFITETFEIPEGENTLIEIAFSDLHLVRNGNGRYVLTPQVDASIVVSSADVSATGTIASVDMDADSLVVTLAEGDATVLYAGAAIFLSTDTDTPTGTEADLVVGATVQITGTIDLDGVITATEIRIQ